MATSIHEKGALLRDAVFAADDGIITTFAVVAGSMGAALSPTVVVILGFANLFADGFSMATGIYLGVKSELEFEKEGEKGINSHGAPVKHGFVTFISFVIAGFFPLIPYLLGSKVSFTASTLIVGLSLFLVGAVKGIFTKKSWIKSGLEVFLIGGVAASLAYLAGYLVDMYVV